MSRFANKAYSEEAYVSEETSEQTKFMTDNHLFGHLKPCNANAECLVRIDFFKVRVSYDIGRCLKSNTIVLSGLKVMSRKIEINGRKIGQGNCSILEDGDEICFGPYIPQIDNHGLEDYRYIFHKNSVRSLQTYYKKMEELGHGGFGAVAFDPHFWSLIQLRLHITLVDHDPERPYPIDQVFDAAQYVFACQAVPSNHLTVPSVASSIIASHLSIASTASSIISTSSTPLLVPSSPLLLSSLSSHTAIEPQTLNADFELEHLTQTFIDTVQDLNMDPPASNIPSATSTSPSEPTLSPRSASAPLTSSSNISLTSSNSTSIGLSSLAALPLNPEPQTPSLNPCSSIPSPQTLDLKPRTLSLVSCSPSTPTLHPIASNSLSSLHISSTSSILASNTSSQTVSTLSSQLHPSSTSYCVSRPSVPPSLSSSSPSPPLNTFATLRTPRFPFADIKSSLNFDAASSNPLLPSGYAPPSDRNFASLEPKPKKARIKPPDPPDISSKTEPHVEHPYNPATKLHLNPSITVTLAELLSISPSICSQFSSATSDTPGRHTA